jgi:ABC-2 type transport system permease protein
VLNRYLAILRVTWVDSLAYRTEAVIWMLVDASPLVVMVYLWRSIYAGQGSISGYDLPQMITYYVVVTLLGIVIGAHSDMEVVEQIRDGLIAPYLLRPLPHITFIFLGDIGWKIMKTLLFLPVFGLALVWLRDYLIVPTDPLVWLSLLLTVPLAYTLFFLIAYLVGLTTFWLQEAMSLTHVKHLLVMLLGGATVPIALFPDWLQGLAGVLPFQYIYSFPVGIYLGQVRGLAVTQGLAAQAIWIAVAYAAYRLMWRAGTRRFALVGG